VLHFQFPLKWHNAQSVSARIFAVKDIDWFIANRAIIWLQNECLAMPIAEQ
jgi:hypothetical protein